METVGPSYRTVCGIAFQAVFALGIMLVAAWGALIKDRMWLQVRTDLSMFLYKQGNVYYFKIAKIKS